MPLRPFPPRRAFALQLALMATEALFISAHTSITFFNNRPVSILLKKTTK